MEWVWRPFFNHEGKRTQIFTHTLYQHYSSPKGFDFDTKSSDDPIIDDPEMQGYNVNEKVQELRDWIDHHPAHRFHETDDGESALEARANLQKLRAELKKVQAA